MIQNSDEQTCLYYISNCHRAGRGNEQLLSLILQSFSFYKLIHVKFNLEKKKTCMPSFICLEISKQVIFFWKGVWEGNLTSFFLISWSYNRKGTTHWPRLQPGFKYEKTLILKKCITSFLLHQAILAEIIWQQSNLWSCLRGFAGSLYAPVSVVQ